MSSYFKRFRTKLLKHAEEFDLDISYEESLKLYIAGVCMSEIIKEFVTEESRQSKMNEWAKEYKLASKKEASI